MMRKLTLRSVVIPLLALGLAAGCGGDRADKGDKGSGLFGSVRVDGSSTVFPITEAVSEEFQADHRGVRVTVGISGTGGGFKKFCAGETDINDASRPIKGKEVRKADNEGIGFIEIPVAFDGLSVIVNPANDWVDFLSIEELHRVWQPGSTIKTWRDLRPEWPERPINLYGPDVDSGTFDYFTEVVNGKSQVCRPDYMASADDNVLVTGIVGDEDALGYFGYAYYAENDSKLKLVPIDGNQGIVFPSERTINDGSYAPLSRPLFIYVSVDSAERPEIVAFVKFYLANASQFAAEVGYVGLPQKAYELGWQRFRDRVSGTVFGTDAAKSGGLDLIQIMQLRTSTP